ncbi:MAG: DUF222 domain-containing protein, partial [Gammaproteobacteria bacterium]
MFESATGAPRGDATRDAGSARLAKIVPSRAQRPRTGAGPVRRAEQIAPGVFRAPGRHPATAGDGDGPPNPEVLAPVPATAPTQQRVPGPGLAAVLAGVDPAGVSSYDLLEAVAGWERLISWAQARQAEVIAAFAGRRAGPYAPDTAGRTVSEFAADEIATRLAITRRAADLKLSVAVELADRLPGTAEALRDGRIDLPKAKAIIEHTTQLTQAEDRRRVEHRVLGRAGLQTAPQLRRSLARAVHAVDSQAVLKRRAKATAERFVHMHPLPDGMAEITAVLPAEDAMTVYTALDTIAHCADPTDPRGIEARRVDALVDVCGNLLAAGYRPEQFRHAAVDQDAGATTVGAGRDGDGSNCRTRRGNRRRRGGGPHIQVTVAATTLLGVEDQPGELAGYGPIPAEVARQIADHPDSTWRRILTDPASGVLLDYGTTVYRPPPPLARHVRARDQECVFPGCRQPAKRCDLDHRTPFPHGPTCAANLGPLCRHHHRAKTEGGWSWRCDDDGVITWTAPTGHEYQAQTPAVLDCGTSPDT